MAIRKSGFQSPWLQMLLGGVAKATEGIEEERKQQNEYARRSALMNQEQQFRADQKSQEQVLAETRLKEQRAYNEGQTKEQRTYAKNMAQEQEEKARQARILQNDPTGQVASAFSPSAWSGDAGIPGGSAVQDALTSKMAEVADITDPRRRLETIEQYNPKKAVGQSAYVSAAFYQALEPLRKAAEDEVRKETQSRTAVDQVNGILARPPSDSEQADAWFDEVNKALANVKDAKVSADLAKEARTVYTNAKKAEKTTSPLEREAIDAAGRVASGAPLKDEYGAPTETPVQQSERAGRAASTVRIAGGTGTAADSTRVGYPGYGQPQPPQVGQPDSASTMMPGQSDAIRGLGLDGVSRAARPAAAPAPSAMPPEYAAAMGGPAVPRAEAGLDATSRATMSAPADTTGAAQSARMALSRALAKGVDRNAALQQIQQGLISGGATMQEVQAIMAQLGAAAQ